MYILALDQVDVYEYPAVDLVKDDDKHRLY